MTFKDFFIEKRIFTLDKEEQAQVDTLVTKYVNDIQRLSPKEIKKISEPFDKDTSNALDIKVIPGTGGIRFEFLGALKIIDRSVNKRRKINVFIIFNGDGDANGAYYDKRNEIFLYHNNLRHESADFIHEILTHEAVHAAQHYKTMSKKYSRAVVSKRFGPKTKRDYYTEPMEREATISGVVASTLKTFNSHLQLIENEIKRGKADMVIYYYVKKLETFLKSMEIFAKTPPENYLKHQELPLPTPIAHRSEFFSILSNDPKLRREYQLKMLTTTQEMIKNAKEVLKKYNLAFEYL